jgi:hypothetical protein
MARKPQESASKAADALAADEADEARQNGERDKGEEEKRAFKAVHNIILAGKTNPPGSTIEITRKEHAVLSGSGSVAGDWDD